LYWKEEYNRMVGDAAAAAAVVVRTVSVLRETEHSLSKGGALSLHEATASQSIMSI
jgi:hypothetical protein